MNGKRRYHRVSLHTTNYYEAREKLSHMGIALDPRIAKKVHSMLAVIPFPTEKQLLEIVNNAIKEYNIAHGNLNPEMSLKAQVKKLFSVTQSNSVTVPKISTHNLPPSFTIRKIFDSMLLKGNNKPSVQNRKRHAFELLLKDVGLSWDDDYAKFHNVTEIEEIVRKITETKDAKNEWQRTRLGYIKEIVTCACNMEPDLFKQNVIANLPKINKSKRSMINPHLPYSKEQLLNIFDSKYDFFQKNPDCFWLCMIGLFTGARANAAMTVQYADIINEDGLDCIYFRSNHPAKNLKNDASERKVPIHKQLLDLGFVDYFKRKQKKSKASDEDFIFSKAITKSGQYNNKYMDRCLFPFFKSIGVKTENAHDGFDFHSFRKNASLIMQEAHIPEAFINDIIGWEGQSTMTQHYSNHTLTEIKAQMDTFEYDFLNPHFTKWKKSWRKSHK